MRRVSWLIVLLLGGVGTARAQTTWTVCASGCDFTTIQAAVNAASSGDTVQVSSGTYGPVAVPITKTLALVGAGPDETTVDLGSSPTWGFFLGAPGMVVSGFRFLGPGAAGDGLYLEASADGCEITYNRFENLDTGIHASEADSNQILDNEFVGNTRGLFLGGSFALPPGVGSNANTVDGNAFLGNSTAISLAHNSENNTLSGNDIGGGTAIDFVSAGTGNVIRDNVITGTSGFRILIQGGSGNTLANNLVEGENIAGVFTSDANTWNDPKSPGTNIVGGPFLGGNAYLDRGYFAYNCEDLDTDRLCDLPYSHDPPADNNVDLLPLRMTLGPEDELDWGDAPFPYPTRYANRGAGSFVVPGAPYLGAAVDIDPDGVPTATALGDDEDLDGDDEDGVGFAGPLVPGFLTGLEVIASGPGELSGWIDFDRDGIWNELSENLPPTSVSSGLNSLTFLVPLTATPGPTYARFRICASCDLRPAGIAPGGEVEDYLVTIHARVLDCGDAPDPPYPTLASSGGACHLAGSGLFLGPAVDSEPNGNPTANADGDDLHGFDDEEGIVLVSDMVAGYTSELDLTSSAAGVLQAWLDLNRDGDWTDPGEEIIDQPVAPGLNTMSFAVPASASAGLTFARLRLSFGGGLSHKWVAANGEVEDYLGEIFGSMPIDLTIQNETVDARRIYRALQTITAYDFQVLASATLCAGNAVSLGNEVQVESGGGLVVRLGDPAGC